MLKVIKQGVLCSIQDAGRHGYRHLGVGQSGALDPTALKLANLLVNNNINDPVIEITIGLAEFEFSASTNFSITGGDLRAKLNSSPLYPGWRYFAKPGDKLSFATNHSAQRAYLAIQGGFAIEELLNAKSTDIQAQFGGFSGRALIAGDELSFPCNKVALKHLGAKQPEYANEVRVLKGPHCDKLPKGAFEHFLQTEWLISEMHSRMGSRLTANQTIKHNATISSQAVHPGVVQLPPNGHPIVLLNDCQTTGGYPIIASVISADLRLFSQLGSKQKCKFSSVSVSQAHQAMNKLNSHLAQFALANNNNIEQ
ncbi:allophanate hydrolase [Pseudoalteromonas citrea]|uniref:Allophanate hydrolase n=2 Tax=Pseudoalteromonas citrea TaxID=43655 RepID=A0AAD4AKA7_9GAMM|nr:biotin-dependent carboxyltransferase family protein [Pseudoalteromonas citrea]KAF7773796.1 allophanate hydrolase [Pseudoalteromonas citrea]